MNQVSRATKGLWVCSGRNGDCLGVAGFVGWKYVLPRWKAKPPPASGGELQVHVLDVGPVNGDAILIVSPGGKNCS